MLINFSVVLIFLLVAFLFIFVTLSIGKLVRPDRPNQMKISTYECGEEPIKGGWLNFNMRFYIIALVFIIFDVEIAFIFPIATVYRDWIGKGLGMLAFFELLVFIGILFMALVYVWRKQDLTWIKDFIKGGKDPIIGLGKKLESNNPE